MTFSKFALLSSLPLTLFLSACSSEPADNRAKDEAAIKELDAKWSKLAGARDVDGTVAYYTEDAVMLAPNEPTMVGKASIKKMWEGLLAPGNSISWEATKVVAARSSDLAYSYGTYTLSMKAPDGSMINDKGKFLEVWAKQTDGKWKVITDTFNTDLPLAAPAPPATKKKAEPAKHSKKKKK